MHLELWVSLRNSLRVTSLGVLKLKMISNATESKVKASFFFFVIKFYLRSSEIITTKESACHRATTHAKDIFDKSSNTLWATY